MVYLCTPAQVRFEAKLNTSDTDAQVLPYILWASERIEQLSGLYFEPRRESRTYETPRVQHTGDGGILFDDYLLEGDTLTLPDGSTLATTYYRYTRFSPRRPYTGLTLHSYQCATWYSALCGCTADEMTLTGVWGYRTNYGYEGWRTVSTLAANATDNATSITVVSAANAHLGQLLRINAEYLRVTAIAGAVLTVERGVNGTTAAAHASTDTVQGFVPEPTIQRAAMRAAAYAWGRRGAFEQATFDGVAVVSLPTDLPAEVVNTVREIPVPYAAAL